MKVYLAKPRGFCAGVERAVDIVEQALEVFGSPVYVRHEIVHNQHVVEGLRRKGAIFVDEVSEIPEGAVVVFSAHGVAPGIREEASRRKLKCVDATCPLVTKVHLEAARFAKEGCHLILIGHKGHPEVEGTMGQVPPDRITLVRTPEDAGKVSVPDPERVAYLTQTTLSVDDAFEIVDILRRRFPALRGPSREDICYATQNRQAAVKKLADLADLILVIGADNSSNANRLREVAEKAGKRAFLVDSSGAVDPAWLAGVAAVGVAAGASTPEHLVREMIKYLCAEGATEIEEIGELSEEIHFPLPVIRKEARREAW